MKEQVREEVYLELPRSFPRRNGEMRDGEGLAPSLAGSSLASRGLALLLRMEHVDHGLAAAANKSKHLTPLFSTCFRVLKDRYTHKLLRTYC
jgi:hypothetical protein